MLGKAFVAGGVVALLWAGTAAADTFCVQRAGCPANHTFPTIQDAVNAAASNNSPGTTKDRILVGPGTYSTTDGNAPIVSAQAGNPVEVAGSGPGTIIAWPTFNADSKTVVSAEDQGFEMHDATVRMPVGSTNTGIFTAGTVARVRVFAPGPEAGGFGVSGYGIFRDGTISVPGTAAGASGVSHVQRSDITANVGVTNGPIYPAITVEDTVIRAVGANAIGASVSTGFTSSSLILRHVDLLGDAGAGSTGVSATVGYVFAAGSVSASADVRSSIIRGFARNFQRTGTTSCLYPACNDPTCDPTSYCSPPMVDDPANITVAYSDIGHAPNPDESTGPGTLNTTSPGGNLSVDPAFAPGTNRLMHNSPLIDRGDPASPASTESHSDRAGQRRKVDGNGDGVARADIGAFEYQRAAPRVLPSAKPAGVLRNKKVTFSAKTIDDPGDTIVSYKWSFDDGAKASGKSVKHAFATRGVHRGTVTVTDVTGRKGKGTARVFVGPVHVLSASISPGTLKNGKKATISYELDTAAPVRIEFRRCNSAGKKCKQKVGALNRTGKAGTNKLKFNGKIGTLTLPPGHYTGRVIAGAGKLTARSNPFPFTKN